MRAAQVGIVPHVLNRRRVLEVFEQIAGHAAELLLVDSFDQLVADGLERHVARRNAAFALEDRKLLAHRNDRRNLIRLEREHLAFDSPGRPRGGGSAGSARRCSRC